MAGPSEQKGGKNGGQKGSLYFVNAWVDGLLIGGASLVAFAVLRAFHSGERTPAVYMTGAWLAWVCNWPHFSATNYRLYRSSDNIKRYPLTACLVPALMVTAVLGSFLSPLRWAPLFVKLFTIWSPYHFSGQTLGVTLLYARRAGVWVDQWERRILSVFIYSTFISQSLAAEVAAEGANYYGIHYPGLHVPPWFVQAGTGVLYAALAGFAAVLWSWRRKTGRLPPAILLIPVLAQFTWFIAGATWASFQEFVPFFHSLQYLLIAWSMQRRERSGQMSGAQVNGGQANSDSTARWAALNVAGGAVLFYFLPHGLAFLSGRPENFCIGVTIAAVQIHHFFVDGVIWKLKRAPVAQGLVDVSPPGGADVAAAAVAA